MKSIILYAFISSPLMIGFVAPQGPETKPAVPTETLPASRAMDPRMEGVESRRAMLLSAQEVIFSGNVIEGNILEEIFSMPPYGADLQTQKVRDEILTLEENWIKSREETRDAIVATQRKLAQEQGKQIQESFGPKAHPLAVPDPIRLALVHLQKREYSRALEYLETASGADARFLEACALDGLNRMDEAMAMFQRSANEASKDPRLLSSTTRAKKFAEWQTQFGRPEDVTLPLRRSPVSEIIQSALNTMDLTKGVTFSKIEAVTPPDNKAKEVPKK